MPTESAWKCRCEPPGKTANTAEYFARGSESRPLLPESVCGCDMSKRARPDAGASVCADPIGALLSTVELARTKLEAMLTNQVDEIAGLKAQLTETAEACGTHVEATNASLVQREEELRAEVRRMQEHAGQMEEVITLNVGGSKFTTSRTTLTGRPSFLATMFSGRHALQASGDAPQAQTPQEHEGEEGQPQSVIAHATQQPAQW